MIQIGIFIDSSKRNLKCVLLHNGSKLCSLHVAYSTNVIEEYSRISVVRTSGRWLYEISAVYLHAYGAISKVEH